MDTPENFEIAGTYAVWDAVEGAEGYKIRWALYFGETSTPNWREASISKYATAYHLTALRLARPYRIELKATRGGGDSEWVRVTTRLPVPTKSLAVPVLRYANNRVEWDEERPLHLHEARNIFCAGAWGGAIWSGTHHNLPSSRANIKHLIQVRANGDGTVHESASRWSEPLVLCADDLVIPPTPTPPPTLDPAIPTETPVIPTATATSTPIPTPKPLATRPPSFSPGDYWDPNPDPLKPDELGEGCGWITDRLGPNSITIVEQTPNECLKLVNIQLRRTKWCPRNVVTSVTLLRRTSSTEVECDLPAPADLKVVNDVALWGAVAGAEGYQLRWREVSAESEATPAATPTGTPAATPTGSPTEAPATDDWTVQRLSARETNYRLSELKRNVAYEMQIQSLALPGSIHEDSGWSEALSFMVPLSKLETPTELTYDAVAMQVSWDPVANADGYTVRVFQCGAAHADTAVTESVYALTDEEKHIVHAVQIRTVYHGSEYEQEGAWSVPLVLCLSDFPTATPTATATATATATPTATATATATATDTPTATNTPRPPRPRPEPSNTPRPAPTCRPHHTQYEYAERHHVVSHGQCHIYKYRRLWTVRCGCGFECWNPGSWEATTNYAWPCPGKNPGDPDDSGPPPYSDLPGS